MKERKASTFMLIPSSEPLPSDSQPHHCPPSFPRPPARGLLLCPPGNHPSNLHLPCCSFPDHTLSGVQPERGCIALALSVPRACPARLPGGRGLSSGAPVPWCCSSIFPFFQHHLVPICMYKYHPPSSLSGYNNNWLANGHHFSRARYIPDIMLGWGSIYLSLSLSVPPFIHLDR